jgi:hypothetical protein
VLQEVVCAKGVDVDVSAHRNELRSGQVVQCKVVMEELGDSDHVCLGWSFSSRPDLIVSYTLCLTYLAEELLELVALDDTLRLHA